MSFLKGVSFIEPPYRMASYGGAIGEALRYACLQDYNYNIRNTLSTMGVIGILMHLLQCILNGYDVIGVLLFELVASVFIPFILVKTLIDLIYHKILSGLDLPSALRENIPVLCAVLVLIAASKPIDAFVIDILSRAMKLSVN